MKTYLIAGLALAASATGAFAQEAASIDITASAKAKCVVSGQNTVELGELADGEGFVDASAQGRLVTLLNGTGTVAWCSGATGNKVVLSRTALVRENTSGLVTGSGFVTAVLYDVGIDIADPNAVNPGYTYDEGTSDGAGSGPSMGAFGGTNDGAVVNFVNDTYTGNGSLSGEFRGVNLIGKAVTDEGATNTFTQSPNRLLAGAYFGTLTLTLTPGA